MLVLDLGTYALAVGLFDTCESLVRYADCELSVLFSVDPCTVSREIEYLEPKDDVIIP